jgi:hypothetical protein
LKNFTNKVIELVRQDLKWKCWLLVSIVAL